MGKRRGRKRGRSRAKNGRQFPADESGIMEWIFDFAFEYERQSDRYRDRAWDIQFEGELPEGYIEAYKAFRTQALDALERMLSDEDFEKLTEELSEDEIALDVWYSVGGHGVGIWDGRWSFLDADGDDISSALDKDRKLSEFYYEMDDQAGAGAEQYIGRKLMGEVQEGRATRRGRARMLNAHGFKEGDRVEFLVNYDVFPFGIVLKGAKARIDEVQDDVVWVLLDEHHGWLDDWDNRISFGNDELKAMGQVLKKRSSSKKGRARRLNAGFKVGDKVRFKRDYTDWQGRHFFAGETAEVVDVETRTGVIDGDVSIAPHLGLVLLPVAEENDGIYIIIWKKPLGDYSKVLEYASGKSAKASKRKSRARSLNAKHQFKVGDRVRFEERWDIEMSANTTIPEGEEGQVVDVQEDYVAVKVDHHYPGLDEWNNVVYFWYDDLDRIQTVLAHRRAGSRKVRARKLNMSQVKKWCLVESLFTDTDNYGYRKYHVIPSHPDPDNWPGGFSGGRWTSGSPASEVEEFARGLATDGDPAIGWPEWSQEHPWDSDSVEHAGDDFYYLSVPQSMTMEPDEYEALSDEEKQDVDNENETIVLQLFFHGCWEDPNDAYRQLHNIHPGSASTSAELWNFDDDDMRAPDESINSWDVVKGDVEIEFEDPTSKRKKRLRSLNPSQLKKRLTKQ